MWGERGLPRFSLYLHIRVEENMAAYNIPTLPLPFDLESKEVMRQLVSANRRLAELRGVALTIPNESILISTLTLQEARESSLVENIVTTQDDLYRSDVDSRDILTNAAAKEVLDYRAAILHGFDLVRRSHILSCNTIKEIQQALEHNKAGFRSVPGTMLRRDDGEVVYTPPQDRATIVDLMGNLEMFINDPTVSDLDPLVKIAIVHHQFESIHPFYDGNGRTGRIVNILMLVTNDLLDLPILYLSRYITRNKGEYYRLIQAIRDKNSDNKKEWQEWILFILKGIEVTSIETIDLVKRISALMSDYKMKLRPAFGKQYKHELLNNLFKHPYTKIEHLQNDLQVSRQTASKYLDKIQQLGLIDKRRIGKDNYYINTALVEILMNPHVMLSDRANT